VDLLITGTGGLAGPGGGMAGVGGLPTGTALMDLLITGTGGAAGPGGGLAGPLGTAGTAGVPQAISHLSESLGACVRKIKPAG